MSLLTGQVSPDIWRRCATGRHTRLTHWWTGKRKRGKAKEFSFCQQENQVCVGPKSRRKCPSFFVCFCLYLWDLSYFSTFRITVSCVTWMSFCCKVTFIKGTRDLATVMCATVCNNSATISSKSASHPFCICYFTRYYFRFLPPARVSKWKY